MLLNNCSVCVNVLHHVLAGFGSFSELMMFKVHLEFSTKPEINGFCNVIHAAVIKTFPESFTFWI